MRTKNQARDFTVENEFVRIVTSFFYIGYAPVVPATWGSLPGLLLAWYFNEHLLPVIVFFSILGILLCASSQKVYAHPDPHEFVLDEVCGMMISLLWIPKSLGLYVLAFFLFRIFDVLKPGPIGMLQRMTNPGSIMWDDMAAGIFVNFTLQILLIFF